MYYNHAIRKVVTKTYSNDDGRQKVKKEKQQDNQHKLREN